LDAAEGLAGALTAVVAVTKATEATCASAIVGVSGRGRSTAQLPATAVARREAEVLRARPRTPRRVRLRLSLALPTSAIAGSAKCFDASGAALAGRMENMLHALAQDGFAALDTPSDACAAIVHASGVGGVMSRTEYFEGALAATWSGGQRHSYIVVPSSQVMRLVLCSDPRIRAARHVQPSTEY
jgi:hypothetical protein